MNQTPSLSIIIPVYNMVDVLTQCLAKLYQHTTVSFEVLVVDNGSKDPIAGLIRRMNQPNLHYVRMSHNTGFGRACNLGAQLAKGQYFAFVNSDVYVAPGWAEAMLAEFPNDPNLAQVGCRLPNTHSKLNADGCGYIPTTPQDPDYIEGSIFMVPRWVVERHGLFDEAFGAGYGEDSDFSLRLRQLGYHIKLVDTPGVVHLQGQTSQQPELKEMVQQTYTRNHAMFRARWADYLGTGRLNRTILLKRTCARGDVFLLTPIIESLRNDNPTMDIDVQTAQPDGLANNPHIRRIIPHTQLIYTNQYDQVYDLDLAYERTVRTHYVKAYADVVGVEVESTRPFIYTTSADSEFARATGVNKSWVVIDLGSTWQGRLWVPARWNELIDRMHASGFMVAGVGAAPAQQGINVDLNLVDRTTIGQVAHVIKLSRVFIGHDGFLAHVAAAVNHPCVLLWGCTTPECASLIDDPSILHVRTTMSCAGCRHDPPVPRCSIDCPDPKCMETITVDVVYNAVMQLILGGT